MELIEKTKLTRIGNSQGFRISKTIINKLNFQLEEEKEVLINDAGEIVIRNIRKPREGWEEIIKKQGQDNCIGINDVFEDDEVLPW